MATSTITPMHMPQHADALACAACHAPLPIPVPVPVHHPDPPSKPATSRSLGSMRKAGERHLQAPNRGLDVAIGAPLARARWGGVQWRAWGRVDGFSGQAGCDCAILRRPPTQDGRHGRSGPRMGEWVAVSRAWPALADQLTRHHHQLPAQRAHRCMVTHPAAPFEANRRTCWRWPLALPDMMWSLCPLRLPASSATARQKR